MRWHFRITSAVRRVLYYSFQYIRLGFKVRTYNYSVLLNYPDFENPNTIKVEKEDGVWWRLSRGRGHPSGPPQAVNEVIRLPNQLDGRSEVWWNAYSANGSVESRIVYCNFGTAEDFKILDEMGISIEGAIVLIRYGALVRSEKVMEAERRGAIGAILYSDPAQYATSSKNIVSCSGFSPQTHPSLCLVLMEY
ncbi:PA domain protein [Ancylostoma duodenale]|uniref:PA domain protein n=1 Tax=Ancylostoma duodenale TaxID=51022 RepID=A0A0C2H698_9BILA|nr:PA domain protein [Ancylostoma duodenale]